MIKIHRFGDGKADTAPKEVLGGKGWGLCSMTEMGVPVPPGIIIPTPYCMDYLNGTSQHRSSMIEALRKTLAAEVSSDSLYSVRSGARVSMPGMMDTILNVGLHPLNVHVWGEKIGKRAAFDCLRRGIQMFGSVAKGLDHELFEHALAEVKHNAKVESDAELSEFSVSVLAAKFLAIYHEHVPAAYPENLIDQLVDCVVAVWNSWNNDRAKLYRKMHGYSDDWGTAVVIQRMVFGNRGDTSCSGVLFTRCPSTGEDKIVGEFLPNAQGEDVVAGIRTPLLLDKLVSWNVAVEAKLLETAEALETYYRDAQEIEFTVEDGELFLLQVRTAKRSARAAFRIAREMLDDKAIDLKTALSRVTGEQYAVLSRPRIAEGFSVAPDATGIPAGGGVVSGVAVFDNKQAEAATEPCVLVRHDTSPDDLPGLKAAVGVLTATGGATCHAAVVARGLDKASVVGCSSLAVKGKSATVVSESEGAETAITITPGTRITIDGDTGRVWFAIEVPIEAGERDPNAEEILRRAILGAGMVASGRGADDRIGEYLVVDMSDREPDDLPELNDPDLVPHLVIDLRAAVAEDDKEFVEFFGDDDEATREAMAATSVIKRAMALGVTVKAISSYSAASNVLESFDIEHISRERAAFELLGGDV